MVNDAGFKLTKEQLTIHYFRAFRSLRQRLFLWLTSFSNSPIMVYMSPTNDLYKSRIGFIYVLKNPIFDLVKIGATRKHPLTRAKELSAPTGVPADYTLAYFLSFNDCFAAESIAHEHFGTRRINESREFFEVTVEEAVSFIESIARHPDYMEALTEEIDTVRGGEYMDETLRREWEEVARFKTPWADLFAGFDQNGPDELSEEEKGRCRVLRDIL